MGRMSKSNRCTLENINEGKKTKIKNKKENAIVKKERKKKTAFYVQVIYIKLKQIQWKFSGEMWVMKINMN